MKFCNLPNKNLSGLIYKYIILIMIYDMEISFHLQKLCYLIDELIHILNKMSPEQEKHWLLNWFEINHWLENSFLIKLWKIVLKFLIVIFIITKNS